MQLWDDLARDLYGTGVADSRRWLAAVGQAQRMQRELDAAATTFGAATADATSPDGAITVQVSSTGRLIGVIIRSRGRRGDDEVATEIVALADRAAEVIEGEWNQVVAGVVQRSTTAFGNTTGGE